MNVSKLFKSMISAGICKRKTKLSVGFTLIEIMISVAIVGILAGVAVPLYTGYIQRARIETAISDINVISLALVGYNSNNGRYPDSLDDVGKASYLDPWGNLYQYFNIQTAKGKGKMRKDRFLVPINSDFDLYSMGKDGKSQGPLTAEDSRDDIIRANDGAYIGPADGF